jgi:hypothetical protein
LHFSHRRHSFRAALALIGAALLSPVTSVPVSGSASADAPIVLGGGSGITVDGSSLCTLTAIGNDKNGNLIGFTSAHCGGPGAQIAAEGAEDRGPVGTMVAGNEALDYAVIQFDPAKVTPTDVVNGFRIDGIGPDPTFGAVSCKLGRTTGQSCGVTWGPGKDPGTIVSQMCGAPGDSGAPVTVDNRLVGMIHGAFSQDLPGCVTQYVPLHTPAVAMSFATQMADITAKNRPGTGFVPTKQSA